MVENQFFCLIYDHFIVYLRKYRLTKKLGITKYYRVEKKKY